MKKAIPLLAILLIAGAPSVRTEAQTATAKAKTAAGTSQASRPQPADAFIKPEPCSFTYTRDGKIIAWAGLSAAR